MPAAPPQGTPPPKEAIFTMPKEFRGSPVSPLPPATPTPPTPSPQIPPPVTHPPTAPRVTPGRQEAVKRSSQKVPLTVLGVSVLILGLLVAGFIVWTAWRSSPSPVTAPLVVDRTPSIPAPESPSETPEPAIPEAPTSPTTPFPTEEIRPARDRDSDGLSDREETLYGTNARLPDTDGDGFLDGNEVFHRYDPTRPSPASLLEGGIVTLLSFEGIQALYPTMWQIRQGEAANTRVVVTGGEGDEFFLLSVEAKLNTQTLAEWRDASPEEREMFAGSEPTRTKNGYPLLVSQERLRAAVDLGDTVIVFVYDVVAKNTAEYLQTFHMMLNSVNHAAPASTPSSPAAL